MLCCRELAQQQTIQLLCAISNFCVLPGFYALEANKMGTRLLLSTNKITLLLLLQGIMGNTYKREFLNGVIKDVVSTKEVWERTQKN